MAVSCLFPSSLLGGSGNKASPGCQKLRHFPAMTGPGRPWPAMADHSRPWPALAGHGRPGPENVSTFGVLVEPVSDAWLLYKRENATWAQTCPDGGLYGARREPKEGATETRT